MDAPPIQYCRTDDGVNIAYSTLGEGPSALFLHPPAVDHLTLEWGVPRFRKMQELWARLRAKYNLDPNTNYNMNDRTGEIGVRQVKQAGIASAESGPKKD